MATAKPLAVNVAAWDVPAGATCVVNTVADGFRAEVTSIVVVPASGVFPLQQVGTTAPEMSAERAETCAASANPALMFDILRQVSQDTSTMWTSAQIENAVKNKISGPQLRPLTTLSTVQL